MTNVSKKKRLIIERYNKRMLGEAEMDCPKSTKDSDLNEKNKKKIADNNQYGLPTKEAKEKGQSCANCVAFDISKRMKDCMDNDSGDVGYCWMHHFMCSGKKWCDTWVEGGPITSDEKSYKKQEG
ncbi:hypothetical protein N9966_00980 [bacterium]|nr:hypothetical protein [bacterium]